MSAGKWLRYVVWALVVLVIAGTVTVVTAHFRQSKVPSDIKREVSFVIFYPTGDWTVNKHDISYDSQTKVLTIIARAGTNSLTLNEQATPDPFNDIPDYYPKLIERLHRYATLDTVIGKVDLTHPEELHGGQSAVSSNKGTLIFASPKQALSDDDWRRLFNTMLQIH